MQLYKGENLLEVAVNQPPGSKGFLLEFLNAQGKPSNLKIAADGPSGELKPPVFRLGRRNAVYNSGFEDSTAPIGWINGPTEPLRGIAATVDGNAGGSGSQVLRLDVRAAARGGLIQRVVVEPGKKYRLSGLIRNEAFVGESYISLFPNEFHQPITKTTPMRDRNTQWKRQEAIWFSGTTRVIYVACYAKATSGKVYFDDVKLELVR